MKASELIKQLQDLNKEFGDLEVRTTYDSGEASTAIYTVEFDCLTDGRRIITLEGD